MIKKWFTVVSWEQGIALLHCDRKNSCNTCNLHSNCDVCEFNQRFLATECLLKVPIHQPLKPGQYVELSIAAGRLLRFATLIYIIPLLGTLTGGVLIQYWLEDDTFSMLGALFGGIVSFLLIKRLVKYLDNQSRYQLSILQIESYPTVIQSHTTKFH